jgi:TolA-binding protein
MGTGQNGTGGTGTGGMGTGGTGTGGMGTGQNGTGGTTSNNGQPNGQQDSFTQYMNAGYAATQQRDYQTALTNFQRALQVRPGNPYATRAIRNVRGYMQRGTTTTPTNQGRF